MLFPLRKSQRKASKALVSRVLKRKSPVFCVDFELCMGCLGSYTRATARAQPLAPVLALLLPIDPTLKPPSCRRFAPEFMSLIAFPSLDTSKKPGTCPSRVLHLAPGERLVVFVVRHRLRTAAGTAQLLAGAAAAEVLLLVATWWPAPRHVRPSGNWALRTSRACPVGIAPLGCHSSGKSPPGTNTPIFHVDIL